MILYETRKRFLIKQRCGTGTIGSSYLSVSADLNTVAYVPGQEIITTENLGDDDYGSKR